MPSTESGLVKGMLKILRGAGAHVDKTHGDPRTLKGKSDLTGCYKSQYFAVEAKQPGKEHTLTELQEAYLRSVQKAGGIGIVATNYDEIRRLIKVMDRRARVKVRHRRRQEG